MGYGRTWTSPRQRGPVAHAGQLLPPPMQAWLKQPHGRRHKAPPQPCALTTSSSPAFRLSSAASPSVARASHSSIGVSRAAHSSISFLTFFSARSCTLRRLSFSCLVAWTSSSTPTGVVSLCHVPSPLFSGRGLVGAATFRPARFVSGADPHHIDRGPRWPSAQLFARTRTKCDISFVRSDEENVAMHDDESHHARGRIVTWRANCDISTGFA